MPEGLRGKVSYLANTLNRISNCRKWMYVWIDEGDFISFDLKKSSIKYENKNILPKNPRLSKLIALTGKVEWCVLVSKFLY